ncbi:MAG: zinc ribbon domain-containing protein [Candidatus Omnitrophica bacterium]|nr:zinc ribbon domain-containing protein [Candidatus Omnitrophota bacterium]
MPLYAYRCNKCLSFCEFLVGVSRVKEDLKCPGCGSKNLNKVFSSFDISGTEKGSSCSSCSGGDCSTRG